MSTPFRSVFAASTGFVAAVTRPKPLALPVDRATIGLRGKPSDAASRPSRKQAVAA